MEIKEFWHSLYMAAILKLILFLKNGSLYQNY
jgi:hypothetical protein